MSKTLQVFKNPCKNFLEEAHFCAGREHVRSLIAEWSLQFDLASPLLHYGGQFPDFRVW